MLHRAAFNPPLEVARSRDPPEAEIAGCGEFSRSQTDRTRVRLMAEGDLPDEQDREWVALQPAAELSRLSSELPKPAAQGPANEPGFSPGGAVWSSAWS